MKVLLISLSNSVSFLLIGWPPPWLWPIFPRKETQWIPMADQFILLAILALFLTFAIMALVFFGTIYILDWRNTGALRAWRKQKKKKKEESK